MAPHEQQQCKLLPQRRVQSDGFWGLVRILRCPSSELLIVLWAGACLLGLWMHLTGHLLSSEILWAGVAAVVGRPVGLKLPSHTHTEHVPHGADGVTRHLLNVCPP